MTEFSPQVPGESPHTNRIPLFLSKRSLSSRFKTCTPAAYPLNLMSVSRRAATETNEPYTSCRCPHILVADDDPIQDFYYANLFQKTLDFDSLGIDKENLKVEVCRSGEELLERYKKYKDCVCGKQVLVITDYYMGDKNLNGVETTLALRMAGYKGPVVLRSSESKEVLCRKHVYLKDMLKMKTIDCFLNKNSVRKTKEVLENLMKATIKVE